MKFLNKHKGKIFILIFILFTLYTVYDTYNFETKTEVKTQKTETVTKKEKTKETKEEKVLVDIKGEIITPGVYELTTNNTVMDAINKAGGLTKASDTSNINLSKKLEDEMVIIIYSKTEIEKQIEFPKPKFLKEDKEEKLTGAQKGTLVHLCMQKLNEKIEYNLDSIKELIKSLVEKEIITQKEADNINPFKILEFTKSNIWQELKQAKEIQREKPFYTNISAKEIYNEEIEENILVQGIIDLYYIDKDDNLILVDYKTDYVEKGKEDELVRKYSKQLEIYQRALEEALNRKVIRKYIYSVYLGKAFAI